MDRLKLALTAPLAPITLPSGVVEKVEEAPSVEEVHRWVDELVRYVERGVFHTNTLIGIQERLLEYSIIRVMEEIVMREAEQVACSAAEFVLHDE